MDKNNKPSTLISLALHLLILISALYFKSANILVPSRSDGMEVSLVSLADVAPTTKPLVQVKPQYHVQNTNHADVVVKQQDKTPVPPKPVTQPPVAAPKPTTPPKAIPKAPKKSNKQNNQLNDLINGITPNQDNPGNSHGAATGGTNAGTSDTNNLLANYADLVIARIRPFIIIPDSVDQNTKSVVEVTLLPNMTVYNVRLVKPSNNSDYDNNILQAINRVNTFPPLPDGADFSDFRKIKLTFRPQ